MAEDTGYGLIIAAIVAIVAIVGLVILFTTGGAVGSFHQIPEFLEGNQMCIFASEQMYCTQTGTGTGSTNYGMPREVMEGHTQCFFEEETRRFVCPGAVTGGRVFPPPKEFRDPNQLVCTHQGGAMVCEIIKQ